jgi:predicted GIY-YIG superfamily endonuclease
LISDFLADENLVSLSPFAQLRASSLGEGSPAYGCGMSKWYVYICNRAGQLYTGITTDLEHRMNQHKATLHYNESFEDKHSAAKRERQMREKKLKLIWEGPGKPR